jgi:hypothetical protein
MFDIIKEHTSTRPPTSISISVCKGKVNLYLPRTYSQRRADVSIKDNLITVNFRDDGNRKFSLVSKSEYCYVSNIVYKDDETLYAKKTDVDADIAGNSMYIKIPPLKYFHKSKDEDEESFTSVASKFYAAIEKLNLQAFVHDGKVAFRYKN